MLRVEVFQWSKNASEYTLLSVSIAGTSNEFTIDLCHKTSKKPYKNKRPESLVDNTGMNKLGPVR
jgi:hypothetical protein